MSHRRPFSSVPVQTATFITNLFFTMTEDNTNPDIMAMLVAMSKKQDEAEERRQEDREDYRKKQEEAEKRRQEDREEDRKKQEEAEKNAEKRHAEDKEERRGELEEFKQQWQEEIDRKWGESFQEVGNRVSGVEKKLKTMTSLTGSGPLPKKVVIEIEKQIAGRMDGYSVRNGENMSHSAGEDVAFQEGCEQDRGRNRWDEGIHRGDPIEVSGSLNRSKRRELNAPKYDGSSSPDLYLARFEAVARNNGWTEEEQGIHLMASLTGDAAKVQAAIPQADLCSFQALKNILTRRFHRPVDVLKQQFMARRQRRGEELQALSLDLQSMAIAAYPRYGDAEREDLMVERFVSGLWDASMQL